MNAKMNEKRAKQNEPEWTTGDDGFNGFIGDEIITAGCSVQRGPLCTIVVFDAPSAAQPKWLLWLAQWL